ncbi:hypothetical protein KKF34_17895 [Myxococcota bacterium]|nr:hypothetical protein [Myxococcota bacterium]MBU1379872.1 hypothetical protein [Myxococcota bacterium]MBU1498757.1 hypothetical protein [Myxococcota bacterium]
MSEETTTLKISLSTHKRLKLISIVEKRTMQDVIDEMVKQRYGERRTEIEDLIKSSTNPTMIKDK